VRSRPIDLLVVRVDVITVILRLLLQAVGVRGPGRCMQGEDLGDRAVGSNRVDLFPSSRGVIAVRSRRDREQVLPTSGQGFVVGIVDVRRRTNARGVRVSQSPRAIVTRETAPVVAPTVVTDLEDHEVELARARRSRGNGDHSQDSTVEFGGPTGDATRVVVTPRGRRTIVLVCRRKRQTAKGPWLGVGGALAVSAIGGQLQGQ
jgi:hypothetical protein